MGQAVRETWEFLRKRPVGAVLMLIGSAAYGLIALWIELRFGHH